ncbi:NAD(P)-binding protein [Dendrothele bispora CBS 962.96]|uniref:NAD(P)-binding protein n=1 Tax=Dendrothele bispora (strain CBS 962.96) TaxID=1314807 RepID=A0A4S8LS80_DENBC|nr:NAD(P)-binding protein [Dendrothele bispora CBS 962.96]
MTSGTKILVTGATGYIGGSVLSRLLQRADFASFDIRVVVRSPEKAKKLEDFGFKSIIGSITDEALMVEAVSDVDVVLALADSDSLVATQHTLKGMKKRFDQTQKPPIFIHNSGTAIYMEYANGMRSTDTVYDDMNPDQIETISPAQIHRGVDLEIIAADKEGYIKGYVVVSSTVYSVATGPLFDAKVSNPHSVQIPAHIRMAIARRQGGMIGDGKNVWPNVEIHELAEFYNILLNTCIQSPNTLGHGREGIYNLMNDEYDNYQLAEAISQALISLGLGENSAPSTFSAEEEKKYLGPFAPAFGSNSRCLANRAKSIGWKPVKTTKDMLASVKPEIEVLIASGKTAMFDFSAYLPQNADK